MSALLDFLKITGLNKWTVFSVLSQINDISPGNLQRVQESI